jgi:hypothetical protein
MTTDHDDSRPPLDDAQIEAFIADVTTPGRPGHGARRGRVAVPPLRRSRRPAPPRKRTEVHGSATVAADRIVQARRPQPMEQAIRRALDRA